MVGASFDANVVATRMASLGLPPTGILASDPRVAEAEVNANCDQVSRYADPAAWNDLVRAIDGVFKSPLSIGDAIQILEPSALRAAVWSTVQYATDTERTLGAFPDLGRVNPLWLAALHSMSRLQIREKDQSANEKPDFFVTPERPPTPLGTDPLSIARSDKLTAALSAANVTLSSSVILLNVPYRILFRDTPLNPSNFVVYDGSRRSASMPMDLWDDLDPAKPEDLTFMALLMRSIARSEALYSLMGSTAVAPSPADALTTPDPVRIELLQAVVEELRILNRGFMKREWDEALAADPKLRELIDRFVKADETQMADKDPAEIIRLTEGVSTKIGLIGAERIEDRTTSMRLFGDIGRVVMMHERRGSRTNAVIAFDQAIEAIVAAQKADLAGPCQLALQVEKIYFLLFHERPGRFLASLRYLLEAPFTQLEPDRLGFPRSWVADDRSFLKSLLSFGSLASLERLCMNVLRSRMWGGRTAVRAEVAKVITSAQEAFRLFRCRAAVVDKATKVFDDIKASHPDLKSAILAGIEGNYLDRTCIGLALNHDDRRTVWIEFRVGPGYDTVSLKNSDGPDSRADAALRDPVVEWAQQFARAHGMKFRNLA